MTASTIVPIVNDFLKTEGDSRIILHFPICTISCFFVHPEAKSSLNVTLRHGSTQSAQSNKLKYPRSA